MENILISIQKEKTKNKNKSHKNEDKDIQILTRVNPFVKLQTKYNVIFLYSEIKLLSLY